MSEYKNLDYLKDELMNFFPEHAKFINDRFMNEAKEDLMVAEKLSENIIKIAGEDILPYLSGYKWTCNAVFEEEMYFRRNNEQYRLSKFQDALDQVYSKPEIMEPYMKGLLLSQVFWKNHTLVHQYFLDFLENYKQSGNYIEIGAGHGLFLAKACQRLSQDFNINAWDISKSSLLETNNCLEKLKIERSVDLIEQDFNKLGNDVEEADLLVFSEILEHLEDPSQVLKTLNGIVKKGGYLFLNAPINSPAPDHITNWRDSEEMFGQVEKAGFEIIVKQVIPATGLTLEKALKQKGAISVIVIARNV